MTLNPQRSDDLSLVARDRGNGAHRPIDHAAVERAAAELLRALRPDGDAETLDETPRRVADAYEELLGRIESKAQEAGGKDPDRPDANHVRADRMGGRRN